MPVDVTQVRYLCPFCDESFGSAKVCRKHISNSTDDEHMGKNGYTMDETIETYYPEEKIIQSARQVNNSIIKAADVVDARDNDGIKEVAEAANVHQSRVMRLWRDEGIEYSWMGRKAPLYWGELNDLQRNILECNYKHNGIELPTSDDNIAATSKDDSLSASQVTISDELGCDSSTVGDNLNKYGWMLLPMFRPDKLDNNVETEEVDIGKLDSDYYTSEDMLDGAKERGILSDDTDKDDKESEDNTDGTMTGLDKYVEDRPDEMTLSYSEGTHFDAAHYLMRESPVDTEELVGDFMVAVRNQLKGKGDAVEEFLEGLE